jgi:serine/threonine protein kinase
VFGLGAVLCELLTGKPPYIGKKAEVLAQASAGDLREAFARLGRIRVEKELIDLTKKCLAADPSDRFPDAGALAEAVAGYQAGWADRLKKAETGSIQRNAAETEEKTSRGKLAAAAVVLIVAGISVIGRTDNKPSPSSSAPPPAINRKASERDYLDRLRANLRERGPRGEQFANLPDSVLIAYSEGQLTIDDLTALLDVQNRRAKEDAKRQAKPEDKKSTPSK